MKIITSLVHVLLFFLCQHTMECTQFTSINDCIDRGMAITYVLEEEAGRQEIVSIPDGYVMGDGTVMTSDGLLLADVKPYDTSKDYVLCEPQSYFNGALAVISTPGQENWYHWLLQLLPRLKIIAESGVHFDKIYLHNLHHRWQKASLYAVLRALNISTDALFLCENDMVIQAHTLIVPSVPFMPAKGKTALPVWLTSFLHDVFRVTDMQSISPYIYISRSHASCRRISNEAELMSFLASYGFVSVCLEELSVYEQAHLFHNAQVIVGPHGSGFANMIFAQPGTHFVEIDHGLPEEQRSFYAHMARKMACYYTPVYVDIVGENGLNDDMHVDIRKLDSIVNQLCYM